MLKWRSLFDKLRDRLLEMAGLADADILDQASKLSPHTSSKMKFLLKQIEMDRMLLAAAVIIAAAKGSSSVHRSDLSLRLSNCCNVKIDHLALFADIICNVCL